MFLEIQYHEERVERIPSWIVPLGSWQGQQIHHTAYRLFDQIQGLKSDGALNCVRGKRSIVNPNPGFWNQLKQHEKILFQRKARGSGTAMMPSIQPSQLWQTTVTWDMGRRSVPSNSLRNYDYKGNISFSTCRSQADQSAREMVISMIVDDGDLKRGNRKTLFQQGYRYFGGLVTKRDKGNVIMMFFSGTEDFRPKGSGEISSDIRNLVGFGRNTGKVLRPNENTMEVGTGNVRYETQNCVRGVDNFPSVENMIKRVQFAETAPLGVISLNEYLSYDRVSMKTTVKSSIVNRLGRTMKVKKTVTEYDDGSVEETETEIMI